MLTIMHDISKFDYKNVKFLIKMQKLIWELYFPTCSAYSSDKNILQYLDFRYFWSSDS